MPDTTTDQVTAALAEMRAKSSYGDAPRLVAALEAVLELHQPGRVLITGALCPKHENHRHFSITGTEAASVRDCPDCAAAVWTSCAGCGPQMPMDSCPVRLAISAALLGAGGER